MIHAESGGNENAYHVNGKNEPMKKGLSLDETIAEAERLIAAGENLDMGVMQINSIHLRTNGLSLREIFDPCINIRVGSRILLDAYKKAVSVYGEGQTALMGALSIYNTGNLMKGQTNGYVEKFYGKKSTKNQDPYTADISVSFTNEVNYEN